MVEPFGFTRPEMEELAHRAERAGEPISVAFRAALARDIRLAILPPHAVLPLRQLAPRRPPLLVILAGDGLGTGLPSDFPQAEHLFGWARFTVLHGTAAAHVHYAVAVEGARHTGGALMVETTSVALPAWVAMQDSMAPRTPGFVIAAPDAEPKGRVLH